MTSAETQHTTPPVCTKLNHLNLKVVRQSLTHSCQLLDLCGAVRCYMLYLREDSSSRATGVAAVEET